MFLQNRDAVLQRARVGRLHELPQVPSVSQFHVQPQEGAVHLLAALEALRSLPRRHEKISEEAQVTAMRVRVRAPQRPQRLAGLVLLIVPRPEVTAEAGANLGVEEDDFSGVQLASTVGFDKEY